MPDSRTIKTLMELETKKGAISGTKNNTKQTEQLALYMHIAWLTEKKVVQAKIPCFLRQHDNTTLDIIINKAN